ncbi:inorganic pyrophosphatase-like [Limulus polyphemus]|uniref:inorganic diphosphatase n=1 Tax=Limulus polyphemus TaxID=6850 RepID=A0ABM1B617_LIMPO|nr:inorganic pyrophosphatase-like [Limulus polyphemus]
MPGFLQATHEWFKMYKIPDGKPPNKFAFGGEAKNKDFAENIITETHHYWEELIQNKTDKGELSCSTVCVEDSPYKISIDEAENIVKQSHECGPAMPRDQSVNRWHFVQLQ